MRNCGLRGNIVVKYGKVLVNRTISGKEVVTNIKNESAGIQALFCLVYNLFEKNNGVLLYDDIDTKIHPNTMRKIVEDINSPLNKHQVIATTNAHYLIYPDILHPDQVWFIEPASSSTDERKTELYSLLEFGKISDLDNWANGYLHGRFGAIPFVSRNYWD